MKTPDNVRVLKHPVAAALLTRLRDRKAGSEEYRTVCHRLSLLLAVEATRSLPLAEQAVETPLETTTGFKLEQRTAIVPVLRAGLGMLEAFATILPNASTGYIGLERQADASAGEYYQKLPDISGADAFCIDPMLATGGSASSALGALARSSPASITLVCILSAPEGIERVSQDHPKVRILTAAIDRELDEKKYIRPGLGDFGDRLFGT